MAIVKLQYEPINVFYLYQQLKNKQYGGIVVFSGTVREWTGTIQTKEINTDKIRWGGELNADKN